MHDIIMTYTFVIFGIMLIIAESPGFIVEYIYPVCCSDPKFIWERIRMPDISGEIGSVIKTVLHFRIIGIIFIGKIVLI